MIGFHWYDLIPLVELLLLLVIIAILGVGIGAGYAWMHRRFERRH